MSDSNRAPTVGVGGRRLWVYPFRQDGPRAIRRRWIAGVLIVFYLVAPWASWRGVPFLRFDIQARHIAAFGQVLSFAEAPLVVFFFLVALLLLFWVTALWGRLWCGYACPQTVFVEWVLRPIEEWIEGNANHRRVVDRGQWTRGVWLRKLAKHALFLLVAAVVANTFVAFFVDPRVLVFWLVESPMHHPVEFSIMVFVMSLFYLDLAWFREQFCSFLCPYARLQTVMMDASSPAVTFDVGRGEPRGRAAGSGDCIDCGLCNRVCPTGIDIRNGAQLECVMCERCMDACDRIMGSLSRPLGLIRKTSLDELEGRPRRILRARVVALGVAIIAALGLLGWRLSQRGILDVVMTRQRGTTYARMSENRLANMFILRVVSRSRDAMTWSVTWENSPSGGEVLCAPCAQPLEPFAEKQIPVVLMVPAEHARSGTAILKIEPGDLRREVPLIFP